LASSNDPNHFWFSRLLRNISSIWTPHRGVFCGGPTGRRDGIIIDSVGDHTASGGYTDREKS